MPGATRAEGRKYGVAGAENSWFDAAVAVVPVDVSASATAAPTPSAITQPAARAAQRRHARRRGRVTGVSGIAGEDIARPPATVARNLKVPLPGRGSPTL